MKIIRTDKKYTTKTGEVKNAINFYVELDNGNRVAISPLKYTKNNVEYSTFKELNTIAERR